MLLLSHFISSQTKSDWWNYINVKQCRKSEIPKDFRHCEFSLWLNLSFPFVECSSQPNLTNLLARNTAVINVFALTVCGRMANEPRSSNTPLFNLNDKIWTRFVNNKKEKNKSFIYDCRPIFREMQFARCCTCYVTF